MVEPYTNEAIIGRGIMKKVITVSIYNPRDNTKDKHHKVDNTPYGGGPGMVMMADPLVKTLEKIKQKIARRKSVSKVKIIMTSPRGKELTNEYADNVIQKKYTDIIFICGRYEGIDARVKKIFKAEDVSIGNYVLTGGELPALVMLDCIARRIPGVLGNSESIEENRISTDEVYTRPEIYENKGKKYRVPKILLSGHAKKIQEWREERSHSESVKSIKPARTYI
jgi:tRNA (guanine37-N1)-methyltransferase